jgi:uncharacterized protein YjbJ (UPF0337 family)
MDKLRVKGAIDEVAGSAKRSVGNLTGDTKTKVEGATQQIKGKVETTIGKLNDATRDAYDKNQASNRASKKTVESDRPEVLIPAHQNGK